MPELNQLQFDLPGYKEQEGVTVAQFMRRAKWHGTHREDWSEAVRSAGIPVHSGSPQAAADRMEFSRHSSAADRFAFPVLPLNVREGAPITDKQANDATTSPTNYDPLAVRDARDALYRRGQSVAYVNEAEDRGSLSFVSPPGGFMTLDETTNFEQVPRGEAFARGSDFAKTHAQRRQDRSTDEIPGVRWS